MGIRTVTVNVRKNSRRSTRANLRRHPKPSAGGADLERHLEQARTALHPLPAEDLPQEVSVDLESDRDLTRLDPPVVTVTKKEDSLNADPRVTTLLEAQSGDPKVTFPWAVVNLTMTVSVLRWLSEAVAVVTATWISSSKEQEHSVASAASVVHSVASAAIAVHSVANAAIVVHSVVSAVSVEDLEDLAELQLIWMPEDRSLALKKLATLQSSQKFRTSLVIGATMRTTSQHSRRRLPRRRRSS
mmetsp:Transcript_6431/g.13039  ORF Transcript_6431/g.13039 Transcript_6431/m.13039 type:complete len:244 (+) Transcript_6431:1615-2346(+)